MPRNASEIIGAAVRRARRERTSDAIGEALRSVRAEELAVFFHASLASDDLGVVIGEGLPASPGAASGRIALSAEAALEAEDAGHATILVRQETSPDDVLGMQAAAGIITQRGGLVSHAAVVARGWGIPAVVGAAGVHIEGTTVTIGSTVLTAGDEVTIDGTTGLIYAGRLETVGSAPPPELDTLLRWADDVNAGRIQVRANADTAADATRGRELGACGIGLCRTEHMFLSADRLPIMRRLILSHDDATRDSALAELEIAQIADFTSVLEAMDGLPVTVRLLDPPLHEFLPDLLDLTAREARGELDAEGSVELDAVRKLHESNPMIGTRGVRLGVVRTGLYEMQVRSLCAAAADLLERGLAPHVEIMIPLVVDAEELRIARSWVTGVLDEIGHPELASDAVTVGAMIETPRAALTAAELAEHADFFSFGTNDLTQLTFAFSRDDVEARLLPAYQALGILPANPFAVLDQAGVGALIRLACDAARRTHPSIKLGACGEHVGHPDSADFLVRQGVDSVSCSPFRVPMARLAVAQALLARADLDLASIEFRIDHTEILTEPTDRVDQTDRTDRTEEASATVPRSDEPRNAPRYAGPGTSDEPIDDAVLLHVLRLRGFATADGLRASLGSFPEERLADLTAVGLVRHVEARGMYALLPAGRERHEALLATGVDDDVRTGLHVHYERFLVLNERFKALCSTWQVREGQPNDHADEHYDRECIRQLCALRDEAAPLIREMATVMPRIERYHRRLFDAAADVERGDTRRFTGVMCESFHDVWMELHEDLIVLQGIDRVAEGSF